MNIDMCVAVWGRSRYSEDISASPAVEAVTLRVYERPHLTRMPIQERQVQVGASASSAWSSLAIPDRMPRRSSFGGGGM